MEDTSGHEEHSSSHDEDPTRESLSRADNMRKVRKERSRLENDRRVTTNNILEDCPDLEFQPITSITLGRKPIVHGGRRLLRSAEVNNRLVQDRSTPIHIIGSDVEALYPSLEAVQVAECTRRWCRRTSSSRGWTT